MKLELTPRLALLASWVPPGARLIDVGTDHGYLRPGSSRTGGSEAGDRQRRRLGPLSRRRIPPAAAAWREKCARACFRVSAIGPEEGDTTPSPGWAARTSP